MVKPIPKRRTLTHSKKVVNKGKSKSTTKEEVKLQAEAQQLIANAFTTRTQLMSSMIDGGGKDLNISCGYPDKISPEQYQEMYNREGVAARVVDVWPEESWSTPPEIVETDDVEDTTEFEKMWMELVDEFNLLSTLDRADRLSGIGQFGVVLIGIDDGKELSQLVEGVDTKGTGRAGKGGTTRKLLYVRPFAQSVVAINETEKDIHSPRFGQPKMYTITFNDGVNSISLKVHWHRIVHLVDNREMSNIYGTPRMQNNWNRLSDYRKVLGGSGEMFWKGGFPGYSLEIAGDESGVEVDTESLKEAMQDYMLGLQRYLALEGVTAKSLAPQVANPKFHLQGQLDAIAIAMGVPKRILFGSEQSELASTQDTKTWHRRLRRRQEGYVTPMVIRPFIDRLIALGVLPVVAKYFVRWPDIATATDEEKAIVAARWAEALSKYVTGDVNQVIPIEEFFQIFGSLNQEQVKKICESTTAPIRDEENLGAEDGDEE